MPTYQAMTVRLDDIETIVSIATGTAATFVVLTYGLGLLIIYGYYRSRFGITEYRIFQAKNFAVGTAYLLYYLLISYFAWLLGRAIASSISYLDTRVAFGLASLPSFLMLAVATGRKGLKQSILHSWAFWVAISALSASFWMAAIVVSGMPAPIDRSDWLGGGVVNAGFSFLAILYYYIRFIYGWQREMFGSSYGLGTAAPVDVQMVCEPLFIEALKKLGVPASEQDISDAVGLLEETTDYYIILVQHGSDERAVKIARDQVKAMLHKP